MFWIAFMIALGAIGFVAISWFMKQLEKEEYN